MYLLVSSLFLSTSMFWPAVQLNEMTTLISSFQTFSVLRVFRSIVNKSLDRFSALQGYCLFKRTTLLP